MQGLRYTNALLALIAMVLCALCAKLYRVDVISVADAQTAPTVIYGCSVVYGKCTPVPLRVNEDGIIFVSVVKQKP